MNSFEFTDKELRRSAARVRRQLLSARDTQDAEAFPFSEGFEANMDTLLRKTRRKTAAAKAVRRGLATCFAVALCLGAWLTFDVGAREAVIDWSRNLFSYAHVDYVELTDPVEDTGPLPDLALPEMVPYFLPNDDYREVSREHTAGQYTVTYQAEDEFSAFSITCRVIPDRSSAIDIVYPDLPGTTETIIGSQIYTLFTPQDATQCKNLSWFGHREDYSFMLVSIAFYFDAETAIKIADHTMYKQQAEALTLPARHLSFVPKLFTPRPYGNSYSEEEFIYQYTGHEEPDDGFLLTYHRLGDPGFIFSESDFQKVFTKTVVQVNGRDARLYTHKYMDFDRLLMWDDGELEYGLLFNGIDPETAIAIAEGVE